MERILLTAARPEHIILNPGKWKGSLFDKNKAEEKGTSIII